MTDSHLNIEISKYLESARSHGAFSESGDSERTNKAYDELMHALGEFRKLPDKGKDILVNITRDKSEYVQCWAATHLLPIYEPFAVELLEGIAQGASLASFDAKMVLSEWREGRLKIE